MKSKIVNIECSNLHHFHQLKLILATVDFNFYKLFSAKGGILRLVSNPKNKVKNLSTLYVLKRKDTKQGG